jgi:hypothetical protein
MRSIQLFSRQLAQRSTGHSPNKIRYMRDEEIDTKVAW